MPPVDTVAIAALPLLHTPPDVASFNVVPDPAQKLVAPVAVIAAGGFATVTGAVTRHAPSEYDMLVDPTATPVITPPDVIVATNGLPVLHMPPPVPSVAAVGLPIHTVSGDGDIGPGPVTTFTIFVTEQPPAV